MAPRARDLARRTYELTSFLTDVRGVSAVDTVFEGTVTYHDSCSSLREMAVRPAAQALQSIEGVHLRELTFNEACCGFGGTFCVKYPDISSKMVGDKCADIRETGAGTLLCGRYGLSAQYCGQVETGWRR